MTRGPRLEARDIAWSAAGTLIIEGVSCEAPPGTLLGIVGPNGAGKTTLLRCLGHLREPDRGAVLIDSEDTAGWGRRRLARSVGVVLQDASTESDPLVWEVVLLGRTPHHGLFDRNTDDDARRARDALDAVDMAAFANRRWQTLSGGERQRIHLARALAQDAALLLLDEPTNHLDIRHQLAILGLIRAQGLTAVAALHDLNIAALFCDALVVMKGGRVVAAGPTADVLTAALIRQVYEVEAEVNTHPRTRRPFIVFLPTT